MDRYHILNEIRRTATENGGLPLGRERFLAATGIRESDWIGKYWNRWSDAVREAGFDPNKRQGRLDDDYLMERLAGFVREIGHYPTSPELRMKSRQDDDFPSHNTFSRFGRKAQCAAALATWCGKSGDWDDVITLCEPVAAEARLQDAAQTGQEESEIGFVYLIKSGKYYKIGRSNSPGRREYELSIQLPEPTTTVHTIKTDDPVGIERYWHERFSSRRKNGEWFELTRDDVAVFHRRKFM